MRQAQCHCGALAVICDGEPIKISLCHCRDCQRRTGAPFSIAAFYPKAAMQQLRGESARFSRPSASGYPVTFHFCPACGSNLWWEAARMPDRIGIAVGAFGDPAFPPPDQAVWDEHRHAWVALPPMPVRDRN